MNLLPNTASEQWVYTSPSRGRGRVVEGGFEMTGEPLSFGTFQCEVPLTEGWVKLEVVCRYRDLAAPENAVNVMLSQYTGQGQGVRRQYADVKPGQEPGTLVFSRLFEVPADTDRGVVELMLRWPGQGQAFFQPPVLTPAQPPAPRTARIVVTNFPRMYPEPDWTSRFKGLFDRVGVCGPDLVAVSEMVQVRSRLGDQRKAAEPIDGAFVTLMSELAAKHKTYVVGNFLEADGGDLFNTSVLLGRDGALTGRYRKTHLPLSEVEGGSSPGNEYPVFETDFAQVALAICWDSAFAEPFRRFKENGAELVVSSTIGDFYPQDLVRAKDNGFWMAVAGADHDPASLVPPSRIYDPVGSLLAVTGNGRQDTFAYGDIDFNSRYFQKWMSVGSSCGEPPSLYMVERRPETY